MRVGELSRRTGVSVPSIKYYLREGMLAPGARTGPNQADYDESHVRRLRLVRALLDVGGLTVAATKDVLAAVDDETVPLHSALGRAQAAMNPSGEPAADEATARAVKVVDELVARRGWQVHPDNPGRAALVESLVALDRLDTGEVADLLDDYAAAMETVAERELAAVVRHGERERSVERTVVGIVVGGAMLGALRAMAEEHASASRG